MQYFWKRSMKRNCNIMWYSNGLTFEHGKKRKTKHCLLHLSFCPMYIWTMLKLWNDWIFCFVGTSHFVQHFSFSWAILRRFQWAKESIFETLKLLIYIFYQWFLYHTLFHQWWFLCCPLLPDTTAGMSISDFTDCFDELASILLQYPKLVQHSKFIFVPGPLDPGAANVLPRHPVRRNSEKSVYHFFYSWTAAVVAIATQHMHWRLSS